MKTQLIGILNLTPDSFSDGGSHRQPLEAASMLIDEGADIIDIGAESTRPGATILTAKEEWARLCPHLENAIALAHEAGRKVSVDTYHPETAKHAIGLGVDWINDVSGGDNDEMLALIASSDVSYIIMHHCGIPASPDKVITEKDPVQVIIADLERRIGRCIEAGISEANLIVDPGVGFGKTAEQSWEILRRAQEFHRLNRPVMIGHSRKSFIADVTGFPSFKRDIETAASSLILAQKEIDYLRVHDVSVHKRTLAVAARFL